MSRVEEKQIRRAKRKKHIRKSISGTAARPRMTVFRSNKRIYAQAIDDEAGRTLAQASSLEKENRDLKLCAASGEKIGELLGARLKEKNIETAVFDRNGYLYHGIIKAVAEGARKAGIRF
ncbi:MAG: 50S ribosomal protein L18 [Spirochaetales bacterium]|jgi:large subunit ribosomal protein L18|nr:50S ribosomal protein L18 [Spirochaetales bacterium]